MTGAAAGGPARLAHIPALDGLRAVAVIGVMAFHGGVSWLPGGFLGVDVFFVLSGYLITSLLLREHAATGTVDLRRFWVRRLRRLLPAVLLVVAAVVLAAPWTFDDEVRRGLTGDGLSALAHLANWWFVVADRSYFAGVPSPLRHLWSLAVEEQWYLLFPPVVVAVLACARSRPAGDRSAVLLVCLLGAAATSAASMAVLAAGRADPSRAYYGTDTRAHTLLVGAIVAVAAHRWPSAGSRRRLLSVAGLAGAVTVALAYATISEVDAWMYRGGFLALAVGVAGLVAALALPERPLLGARVLSSRPLVAIGRVSYGLYLWHWPVDVALTPSRLGLDGGGVEDLAVLGIRTAVASALAVASLRLVEDPIRRDGLGGLRPRVPGARRAPWAVTAGATGVVAVLVVASGSMAPAPDLGIGGERASGVPPLTGTTVPFVPAPTGPGGLPAVPADRPIDVMVTGDSVAFSLVYGATGVPDGLAPRSRALVGCGLAPGLPLVDGRPDPIAEGCEGWPAYWQQGAAERPPDVVLVAFGAWEVHDHRLDDGTTIEVGSTAMAGALTAALDEGVRAVLAVAPEARFAFIGAPCMRPEDTSLGGERGGGERRDPARLARVNRQMEDYAATLGPRARYDDLGDLLCPDGEPLTEVDGVEVRPDGLHHAPEATGVTWRWLEPRLRELTSTEVPPGEVRVP